MTDSLKSRITQALYDGICEHCDGYVEDYRQYPGGEEHGPAEEVVDGRVDFPAFAEWLIDTLNLGTC